jgi:uncharacterized protein (DUF1697 family)
MQYIILLRGINVGGRTIKMDKLKSCLETAGYKKVLTVLQTGNLILESDEKTPGQLRSRIESHLTAAFNYPAKVLVIKPAQLKTVIAHYPFSDLGPEFHRYVIFTEKGFEQDLVKSAGALDKTIEDIGAGKDTVYWYVQKGHTLDSMFGKYMSKASAKHFLTNRNLNTLEKILAKCG